MVKLSELKQKKVMRDLKRIAGNNECAECYSPNPSWASINLGIFVCINCSGIHRSFGTSISKVRSIDMDIWEEEWTRVIQQVGNTKSNKIWENSLDHNDKVTHLKNGRLKEFLKKKYVNKTWKDKSTEGTKKKVVFGNSGVFTVIPETEDSNSNLNTNNKQIKGDDKSKDSEKTRLLNFFK
eukprot:GAHX01002189.1.p1 GENE.GAHX01002189.1~~GAHX01002189.1.p1  ORF type:complete len:181 (-),score=35.79 GAHX01002189.1:29-571(-)